MRSPRIERTSGNVYADLSVKDADAMLAKAELAAAIGTMIRERGIPEGPAAESIGLASAELANVLQGDFQDFSERQLLDCLIRLRSASAL